ncbi:MAG TPA: hypothetical protein VF473_11170 [Cyclobacteriaceae bacterium]
MPIKFLLPLIFLSASAFAQVSQVRFELPLRPNQSDAYKTIPLGHRGLLLYSLFYGPDQDAIEMMRLDTAFQTSWRGFIPLGKGLNVISARLFENQVMVLLKDRFNPQAEFTVLSVNVSDGNYGTRGVKTLLPFQPTHFAVTSEAVLIGGYFNYRPLVLYYSFATNRSKILPGFFNDVGELDQVVADENGNIDIVVSGKSVTRRRSLWIRNYDKFGDLTKTILLEGGGDKALIFGRSMAQPDGNQLVCGVYGRYTEYSRGIFIANVDPFGEYTIKYYNYADLKRFFNYMKARREKRVRERIERRRIRGKKIKFNYRLMVDEFMQYGDNQFVMLGEAFYPHYSYPSSRGYMGSSSYYNSRYMGPYYGRGDLVFDGYQYTHAVVIGFDKEGNVKWDNSFEINDVRSMNLEQFVKIHPEKEKVSLLYLFDNVIRSKIIQGTDVIEGKSYDQLHTGSPEDFVKERDTQQTKLDYWYGDVFYASGIQNIRRKNDQAGGIVRRVFFINKIAYK